MSRIPYSTALCGCWYIPPQVGSTRYPHVSNRRYLPQVRLNSYTTILATTSRTVLRQIFQNPLDRDIEEVTYTFPLYDGVSIGAFTCTIADRTITGVVKEIGQARTDYEEAKDQGHVAGLFELNADAADVFTTSIGNIPAGEIVLVEITYLGELKNDAETDGARFTIPTSIAPRYGAPSTLQNAKNPATGSEGINITVDIVLEAGCAVRGIQSPSHPIAVTMGRTSTQSEDLFESNLGSATLALGSAELDKDFLLVVLAKDQDTPRALLETHADVPQQRALLATLVPKFNIPNDHPEIVFVVDRSGSMVGKMHLVIDALNIFLRSLPIGVKFNICSFGSRHTFLFDRSKTYDAASLAEAKEHIAPSVFQANYGGTEMHRPIEDVIQKRYKDLPLEVMLMTDGEIWNQETLFEIVNQASAQNARFFTLGIGSGASSALVEGVAIAGHGFSQWVLEGERIDKRIVRMLKGALSPHIQYKLEVKYSKASSEDDGFEMIDSSEKEKEQVPSRKPVSEGKLKSKIISLFNIDAKDEPPNQPEGKYDHLPSVTVPSLLQAPYKLPELYPHSRTTVYLLLGGDTIGRVPERIILHGKSSHGDLELEIPIQNVGKGKTIHQLAAKKAMQDLEEGRGWLTGVCGSDGKALKSQHEGKWDLIVEREVVRLGTTFQVAGKHCSFVAIETTPDDKSILTPKVLKGPPLASAPPPYHSPPTHRTRSFGMTPQMNQNALMTVAALPPPTSHTKSLSSALSGFRRNSKNKSSGARRARMRSGAPETQASPLNAPGGYGATPQYTQVDIESTGVSSFQAPGGTEVYDMASDVSPSGSHDSPRSPAPRTLFSRDRRRSPRGETEAEAEDELLASNEVSGASLLDDMHSLISLQSFTGSWSFSKQTLMIVSHGAKASIGEDDIKRMASMLKSAEDDGGLWVDSLTLDDWATVLAISWLDKVMEEENDVWDMVAEKARRLLESRCGESDRVHKLVSWASGEFWVTEA